VQTSEGRANEWGFFDYNRLNENIESFNRDFANLSLAAESVDIVYSISVVEHMPAAVRRDLIETARRILRKDGKLVLTFDLLPGSNALWNRNLGKEVEPLDLHGDLCSVIDEFRHADLVIEYLDLKRSLPRSRTDIAVLCGRKRRGP
jgi:SAM-dependent methyltransferase